ncbi:unnamed protein product [Penicillium pancosmium]
MRPALLTLLFCALVTAHTGEDAPEKWTGPKDGDMIHHGVNNIGNGNGGGLNIDTEGGDIGSIGIGVGGGCDPATCDAKCRASGNQSGYCSSSSGSPSLLGLVAGTQTAS